MRDSKAERSLLKTWLPKIRPKVWQVMSPKDPPSQAPPKPSREDRLAKALRDNLSRRKALTRSRRERGEPEATPPDPRDIKDREDPA
jgi:hypothetical protein